MDGGPIATRVVTWKNPRDPLHPHQMWLCADCEDCTANFAAFQAADAALSDSMMDEVWHLHDSAQYHFIQMLLWRHEDGSYRCTSYEALAEARKHHQEVTK